MMQARQPVRDKLAGVFIVTLKNALFIDIYG